MFLKRFNILLITTFFLLIVKFSFSETYRIDGYVINEDNLQPVIHQIVVVSDQFGGNLISFETNHTGLYSGTFNTDPVFTPFVIVELTRNCSDSLYFYSQQVQLDNPYLTCNFFVCNNEPCHANFNIVQSDPHELTFEFRDISTGIITAWFWEFGDGQTSNEQNPVHTYNFPEHYPVKLTITGKNCTDMQEKVVHAFMQNCLSKFSYIQTNQNGEIYVQFTDESVGNNNDWFWEFGDGSTSQAQNPLHNYNQPGEYEVKLFINGPGCNDFSRQIIILDPASLCYPLFNSVQIPDAGYLIQFSDLSIGSPQSWFWQFGDGQTSDLQNPAHLYQSSGNYMVSLKITGVNCDAFFDRSLTVKQSTGCLADFSFVQNSILDPVVSFTNLSSGDYLHYHWDFGDGTTSQDTSPVHQFPGAGVYQVMLRNTGFGCHDSIVKQVEVIEPVPCVADFTFSSSSSTSLEISFENLSTGMIIGYEWDFGDGSFSTDENPVHIYAQPGNYQVKLTIDAVGCQDDIEKTVVIEEPVFCDAAFSVQQEYPQSRLINFVNQSVGNNFTSSWEFGDGSFSTETNPQHSFDSEGQYTVQLRISTADECTDSIDQIIEILPPLSVNGKVYAGTNLLTNGKGEVYFYRLDDQDNVTLIDHLVLEDGNFEFGELIPGSYFLQAIPIFNLSFPTIPNYFPTYSGYKVNWNEAEVYNTDNLPDTVDLFLFHYDEFFDGDASVSGKIVQTSTNDGLPVIILLKDEAGNLKDYTMLSADYTFEFGDIPFGSYTLYPEKAGKSGQSYNIDLTEEKPELTDITFLENSTSIVPDLSAISEIMDDEFIIFPNPAEATLNLSFSQNIDLKSLKLEIFSADQKSCFQLKPEARTFTLDVSGFKPGVYFVRIINRDGIFSRKLIIR